MCIVMDRSETSESVLDTLGLGSVQFIPLFIITSVRIVVIVGIVGLLSPFFTQSFVLLGFFKETPQEVPIVLLGVIAGILLPLARKLLTIAISERE